MSVGIHFRGWFFAAAVSLVLLIIVAVPPAYENSSTKRNAFVGVLIPVVSGLYFLFLYVLFHRPLRKGIEAYTSETSVDINGLSKELRKVDAAAAVVLKENETLRRFLSQTVGDARVANHGAPITPRQEFHQPSLATPATVGRCIALDPPHGSEPSPARIRRKKNHPGLQPPSHKEIDDDDDGLVLHSLPETPCAS